MTNVIIGGESCLRIADRVSAIYKHIKDSLAKNKLIINESKTTAVLFSTDRDRKEKINQLDIENKSNCSRSVYKIPRCLY